MPAPVKDVLTDSKTEAISFSLEPALSAVHSLFLLTMTEKRSGLGEWVLRTKQALSAEEAHRHHLVMVGFYYLVNPEHSWPNFPAFLDYLSLEDAVELRDKLLEAYAQIGKKTQEGYDKTRVLASVENYLDFLRERFDEEHLEEDLEREAYEYMVQPEALKELIITHLRMMWEEHLKDEWERVRPMLEDSMRAFQQIDYSQMSTAEIVAEVADEELDGKDWEEMLEEAEKVIFVPSAHVGPYVGRYYHGNTLWVLFGARLPEGVDVIAPDLSRADIVVRLNALADDDRLSILKLISERGERRSKEVIEELGFSQSASSRHLKQLSATGFLTERRCNGAKCYALNPERIEHTLNAVSNFLLVDAM